MAVRKKRDWMQAGGLRWCGALVLFAAGMVCAPVTHALPSYSRQTSLACDACHAALPRLNERGAAFLLDGYFDREQNQAWDSRDALEMLSMRLTATAALTSYLQVPQDSDTSLIGLPQTLDIYASGNLWQSAGFFVDIRYDRLAETEQFQVKRASLVFTDLLPDAGVAAVNVKLGVFDHGFMLPLQPEQALDGKWEPDVSNATTPAQARRLGNIPLVYADKFYGLSSGSVTAVNALNSGSAGMRESDAADLVPGHSALLHQAGNDGLALYGRPWGEASGFWYQTGVIQAPRADSTADRLDAYLVLRYDFALANGTRLRLSAFQYQANNAALATLSLNGDAVFATGGAGTLMHSGLAWQALWSEYELEGVFALDRMDEPVFSQSELADATWQTSATAHSLQGLWHYRADMSFFARIDNLSPGGLKYLPTAQDGEQRQINIWQGVLGGGVRWAMRENILLAASVYLNQTPQANRWPAALGGGNHPAANNTELFLLALDVAF